MRKIPDDVAHRARLGARAVRRRRLVAGDRARPRRRATFDDEVVDGAGGHRRAAGGVDWVTCGAVRAPGDVLERLARAAVAAALRALCPRSSLGPTERPPQREMANAAQQAANVRGAFRVTGTPPPGTGVLLDDRRISGWTLAMVGGQLRRAGAERVVPLALATLQ